jgi:hypothetical protein
LIMAEITAASNDSSGSMPLANVRQAAGDH